MSPHFASPQPFPTAPQAEETAAKTDHHTASQPHFGARAVWRCENRHTLRIHTIHGPLAEILTQYPCDYALRYLGTEPEARL